MRKWLAKGVSKAKRMKVKDRPGDGAMTSLFYGDLDKTGGHYQVELIHDTRFSERPWVDVFWWPRTHRHALSAKYHLTQEL